MARDTIYHWEPESFSEHLWQPMELGAVHVYACRYCGRRFEVDAEVPQECVSPSRKKGIGEYIVREPASSEPVCHYCGHVIADKCDCECC